MINTVFQIRGLRKKYGRSYVLKGIDLDVPEAEITGIIGPDGAGKSTILKICSGLLRYEGSVLYRGQEVSEVSEPLKRVLSFMPQGIGQNLYMELTVEENIEFFALLKGLKPDSIRHVSERLLQATGLWEHKNKRASELSGGMKQKLGICCALISRPQILILDEPSTGIDPLSRRQLWDLLVEYLKEFGTTILYGTSYMDEAERCHNILLVDQGRGLFRGTPESILADGGSSLEERFFQQLRGTAGYSTPALPPEARAKIQTEGIVVRDVVKSFGGFVALDNVSLTINPGEVFGLLGPNGAGKTTLIKCMLGLLKPERGEILVAGMKPGAKELRYRVGYMSQIFSLYADLTVKENIELYGGIYGVDPQTLQKRRQWIVDFSGLQGYENAKVKQLPLGMKQRLALGCAILHLPEILFLDEPTSGVDPLTRRQFWSLIKMLSEELGITVVVTTHNLIEADFCDRLAIMQSAKVVATGTPGSLRARFIQDNGEVFEVLPDGDMPVETLKAQGISVVPFGRRYHLYKKGLSEKQLREILDQKGKGIQYIRRLPPPMEVVFINFLSRQC